MAIEHRIERVDFKDLDLSTPAARRALGERMTRIGQAAVADELSAHRAAGNPFYYRDATTQALDQVIKETPDGGRQRIRVLPDGQEIILQVLSRA